MNGLDITRASGVVGDALLDSLHSKYGGEMLPRSEAQHKVRRMRSGLFRRKGTSVYLKRVASVILILALSTGMIFTFSEEARAYVTNWVREINQSMTVYHFYDERSNDVVASVRLKYMAKGYFEKEHGGYGNPFSFIYENEEGERLTLDGYRKDKFSIHLERSAETAEEVMINGNEGEFYDKAAGEKDCMLIWSNTGQNLAYVLIGDLGKDEMIRIAEGVVTKVYVRSEVEDDDG